MSPSLRTVTDAALPGIATALDLDALFAAMRDTSADIRDRLELIDGRAMDVQYTPGVGAHVLWKLRVHDRSTGRTGRQLITARVFRSHAHLPPEPSELLAQYAELRRSRSMLREMPLSKAWIPIPSAGILVHAFPVDPDLPSLMTVGSPGAMKVALGRAWRARGARVRRVNVDTLSYTPGARAAMRYEVLAEDRETALPELRHLVGKLDVRKSPARIFAGHWAVWRKTFGKVAIAPPVGYVAVARLSLQEFLTGTRLSDTAGEGEFIGRVRQTARAIAVVHGLQLPLLKQRTLEKEMQSIDRWSAVLAGLRPGQADRLARLGERLRAEMASRMRVTATIHADFHLANILSDDNGITLIDWDQVAHGDPMLDVGRFLASLRVSALRLDGNVSGLADVEEQFLEEYLGHSRDNEQRARLFEAASLLTAAAAPFRLQREGWEEQADVMIDEVERMLTLSRKGEMFAGTAGDDKRQIPYADRTEWAADRVYAQAQLVPLVHASAGGDIEVTECHPRIRESSESRIYMRWILKGYRKDDRWRRAVEAVGFPETSGRSKLHRLEQVSSAAGEEPASLRVPLPLGLIAPLSLIVFDPPEGRRLDKMIAARGSGDLIERVAVALARFHGLDISLTRDRSTKRIMRSAARTVRTLRRNRHPEARPARDLLRTLTTALESRGERRAPCIFPLALKQLWIDEKNVSASPVNDIVSADPLINAATILSELSSDAQSDSGISHAERFRAAYLDASGESESDLASWEAFIALRLTCLRAIRKPELPLTLPSMDPVRL
jgi:aminoglycoside phosphotransferase (APT) family kinase protein